MSRTKPTSFRLPSKYIVFLDHLAAQMGRDRTKVLIDMLDIYLRNYLKQDSQRPGR